MPRDAHKCQSSFVEPQAMTELQHCEDHMEQDKSQLEQECATIESDRQQI